MAELRLVVFRQAGHFHEGITVNAVLQHGAGNFQGRFTSTFLDAALFTKLNALFNANLLFKWHQQWREGKLQLPPSDSPQLLPVSTVQSEPLTENAEALSISCEVTGILRLYGAVSENLLNLLIQELKR